jgi:hypothetical protein
MLDAIARARGTDAPRRRVRGRVAVAALLAASLGLVGCGGKKPGGSTCTAEQLQTDPENCGACGHACSFPHANGACLNGQCTFAGCSDPSAWRDLDGDPENGCEYTCPVSPPVAETCNGVDDDCNGIADDNLTDVGGACGEHCPGGLVENCVGECQAGTLACDQGVLTCVGSVGPSPEVCNGKDDDCDGVADDNLMDAWVGQACCPTGNLSDCLNSGTGTRCEAGVMSCSMGGAVCLGGTAKSAEICNGVDDDCNGIVDDVAGIGGACTGGGVNTKGACTAAWACSGVPGPGPGGLTCTQVVGPKPEVCNGIDDDCSGVADDNLTDVGAPCGDKCPGGLVANCKGECKAGVTVCSGGAKACSGSIGPTAEICDGKDNDCNGVIDDGFGYPNYASDPANCGACGNACALPNATNGCHVDLSVDPTAKGVCTVVACNPGKNWVPSACGGTTPTRDGPAGVGCYYTCPVWPLTAEVCDGKDNNCDGQIDEMKSACDPSGLVAPANFCSNLGVCQGQTIPIVCTGAGGWKCNYSGVPNVEADTNGNLAVVEKRCDGLDGNCNGIVDRDGFPTLGNSCTAGLGVCQTTGSVVCKTATTAGCNAVANLAAATDETCNGKDDDCDGIVDGRDDSVDSSGMAHKGWRDAVVAVPIAGGGTVYVYAYEASHPGATMGSTGSNSARACSVSGVLPWATVTEVQAAAACAAVKDSAGAPMRLCTAAEWQAACEGPAVATPPKWSLSRSPTTYVAQICNDANEQATPASWATGAPGAMSAATGAYCYTDWGASGRISDLSGNLAEWTSTTISSGGNTYFKVRGGSYLSPTGGTTCEFDFDIYPASFANQDVGFRCCADNPP